MRLRGLTAQRDRASKPTVPSMRTSDAQEDQSKRSPDNVRQDECWFSQLRHVRERVRARSIFAWRRAVIPLRPVCWPIRLFVPITRAALALRSISPCRSSLAARACCPLGAPSLLSPFGPPSNAFPLANRRAFHEIRTSFEPPPLSLRLLLDRRLTDR